MEEYESYNKGQLLKQRYSKITDLSEGSYGLVSLAKDTKLDNRLVAIKYIYPLDYKKKKETRPSSSPAKLRNNNNGHKEISKKQNTKEILKSLYEEAAKEISVHQILGEHPNIAILFDHFDSYLVLEYCGRGDLYEAIQNGHGPSLPSDIKDVFRQILDAIEYCHANNVYHRDLKPENILISDDWSIKLCDWGLATTSRHVTDRSEFDIGSERYMAPELFDSEITSYDAAKIDLWSIGIILLTLVFHKNPFEVANYSDKRFVQFAANRESLFDIFSTMTGDLFSVLRFCLNLDPTNRDLASVKTELEILNYFTIDDEFCSSDFDDYYSDEDQYEEEQISTPHEDGVVEHYVDTRFLKDQQKPEIVKETDLSIEVIQDDDDDEGESTFYMEDAIEANKSTSTLNNKDMGHKEGLAISSSPTVTKETTTENYDMPYNERAEALLSNSTSLKPIPINHDFNYNGRGKYFRNTRKPISVASYQSTSFHKAHNKYNNHGNSYGYQNNKFNREDFFTPKSVFNHYMNKYGESRDFKPNHDRPKLNKLSSNWKKNNNKPKSWKKNYRNSYKNNKKYHYNNNNNGNSGSNNHSSNLSHSYNQNYNYNRGKYEFSGFNTPVQHRRKSNSFSSSKSRSVIASSLNNQLSGSYMNTSTGQNLNTVNSYGSSTGKYVPPSMRSPNYMKSPLIHASSETIEHLSLNSGNDYGVFDLEEDDLDLKADRDKKKYKIPTYNIPSDKNDANDNIKYNDNSSTSTLSSASNPISQIVNAPGSVSSYDTKSFDYHDRDVGSGGSGTSSNGDRQGRERPASLIGVNDGLAANSNGKYIPPFRRRSQSNGPGNGFLKDREKRRSKIEDISITDNFNKLNLNGHGFSVIPNPTVDWYSKHEWSD